MNHVIIWQRFLYTSTSSTQQMTESEKITDHPGFDLWATGPMFYQQSQWVSWGRAEDVNL